MKPERHSWGLPKRFAQKKERQCLKCRLVEATFCEIDNHGRKFYRIEWYRGIDRIESKTLSSPV